ncbi:MAG: hypothetical protein ACI9B8_001970 [Sulfitobacter sp.]|jgi:uncharacterized protein (DUF1501 family)
MRRRKFLTLSASALASSMIPLRAFSADAGFSDYKCLVNIFLLGGNDAFNLVVPSSSAEYNIYAASRQNLAVPQADLLAINPSNPDGASYGFHPSASVLRDLFEAGDLAVMANIGPLIEPTTKDAYLSQSVALPPQLFSHNDQQDQWYTLRGKLSLSTGWAGRIADLLQSSTQAQQLALNTSLFGTTLFQASDTSVPYTVGVGGANTYGALDADAFLGSSRRAAFEAYLDRGFTNLHARALSEVHQRSLGTADQVNEALALVPQLATPFPDSSLGKQLNTIARLIAVKDEFAMSRQIFFAATGGFDTHDNQNQVQPNLIQDIADSVGAFNAALMEISQSDSVVTFTQSDFGRTLTSNGDGTDHGWGSHQIVTGSAVIGRDIYGTMPTLEIGGEDDATGGRIIPTTSADQYAATLARWFGVDESDLAQVAPNLGNFTSQNLGFLG